MRVKVLILTEYFYPSKRGGGPVQSIINLIDNLSEYVDFYVITSIFDLGVNEPYNDLVSDQWVSLEKCKIYYTDINNLTIRRLKKIIGSEKFDVAYVNFFFSLNLIWLVLIYKLKISKIEKIIIAPRGQFSKGALFLKNKLKLMFLFIFKVISFHTEIFWHSTSKTESEDVYRTLGRNITLFEIENFTENYKDIQHRSIHKDSGSVEFVFVSRIHPKKNLLKAIEYLKEIDGNIVFDIYGPIEDKIYWKRCEASILKMPSNIKVSYKGLVDHENVINTFMKYHFFLFPTLGENFGHVISEALIAGCPVILSDQTPWLGLNDINAGWDINLEEDKKFIEVIRECVEMNDPVYQGKSLSAFNLAFQSSKNNENIKHYISMFS